MLDGIKMYKKNILRIFLQLKRPEYLIYAPFETIYHTVEWLQRSLLGEKKDPKKSLVIVHPNLHHFSISAHCSKVYVFKQNRK